MCNLTYLISRAPHCECAELQITPCTENKESGWLQGWKGGKFGSACGNLPQNYISNDVSAVVAQFSYKAQVSHEVSFVKVLKCLDKFSI